ncbi:MAG: haloacid dehalogenase type II [Proteobacteria bacterium]|nr:haloacid dehalogenase type II [Pseudomonadota bacterium]
MASGSWRPKFITFDCYGTLIKFGASAITRELFAGRISGDAMDDFVADYAIYRLDEVLGAYKPYPEVLKDALRRTCTLWKLEYRERDGEAVVAAVPTWGPHPDVPSPLAEIAKRYPLVILSNAKDSQISSNVEKLGAPFHGVYTAEQAKAYKPRLKAFEYMFDRLGCGPADVLHVSSSLRYDLMPAHDLRISNKVYVNRGYEPSTPYYGYHEIADLSRLPKLVGL